MVKRYSDSIVTNTTAVSENLTNLMQDIRAEHLLKTAAYYIDAIDSSSSGQTIDNLGTAKDLLPTTIGSSTSADSNDPVYLSHTGTNYVYTTGVANNNLSVPDAAALDITGDIDLRWYGALDDWTPSATNQLIGKTQGGNISYGLGINTTGRLQLSWSTDGSTVITRNSTVAPTIADGATLWVRAVLDVNNGASGHDAIFYTSTDGTTWTQLGTTVTTAGTTSIYSGIAILAVGSTSSGASPCRGKLFRAQIFNGIDGTKVLDVDTSVINNGSATSFTDLTGQTVTINRSTAGKKTVAVTQPTWLFGTDDYMEVNNRYMASGTYLYLPGVNGNYCTSPDSAALDITGDIDIRYKIAMDDWTPAGSSLLVSKWGSAGNRSYYLYITTGGGLSGEWSADGTAPLTFSSSALGLTDGTTKWVRWTMDVNNGAGGRDHKFYTSDDGTTWTQIGATVTQAGTTSIYAGTAQLELGSFLTGVATARGKHFRAQVFNGIDGTVAFDANFETGITSLNQASFTESSANAATVTINRSGSAFRSAGITGTAGYLYPGATNTFSASATDLLNFGAADSFTILSVIRNWPTVAQYVQILQKGEPSTGAGYGIGFWATSTQNSIEIKDVAGLGNVSVSSNYVEGNVTSLFGITNRLTNTVTAYTNSIAAASTAISNIGSLQNISTFKFGVGSYGSYYNGEFIAAAVFRRALTNAEVALISSYFQRRDA